MSSTWHLAPTTVQHLRSNVHLFWISPFPSVLQSTLQLKRGQLGCLLQSTACQQFIFPENWNWNHVQISASAQMLPSEMGVLFVFSFLLLQRKKTREASNAWFCCKKKSVWKMGQDFDCLWFPPHWLQRLALLVAHTARASLFPCCFLSV